MKSFIFSEFHSLANLLSFIKIYHPDIFLFYAFQKYQNYLPITEEQFSSYSMYEMNFMVFLNKLIDLENNNTHQLRRDTFQMVSWIKCMTHGVLVV